MLDIWHFAITSTRREDEICRLLWEDNDPKTRTGLVHDAEHPENKEGNHRRFRYTQEPWNTPNFWWCATSATDERSKLSQPLFCKRL